MSRWTRSSWTGGPGLRLRPRFLANTDQIPCSEHSRWTRFSPDGDPGPGELVGDEPVSEGGVVVMDVQRGVDEVGVVPVPITARLGPPPVEGLLREAEHPTGHRHGGPVSG